MAEAERDNAAPSRDSWLLRLTDWVFGYDYFVSYSHRDGKTYPRRLKERLEASGFRVFLDQTEYVPGTNLNRETRRQVLKSRVVVIVGRDGALASEWVEREVRLALGTGKDPVLIDVNGAVARAGQKGLAALALSEHWLRLIETLPGDDGEPSDMAVSELVRGFGHTRQETRRMRLMSAAAGVLALAAVVASWLAVVATNARQVAETERLRTEISKQSLVARKAEALAEVGNGTAASQLALESVLALEKLGDGPETKAALDAAYRALHRGLYARREAAVLAGDESRALRVAFSPDSRLVAVGKQSGAIEVYTREGRPVATMRHAARIVSVAFDHAGGRILAVSADGAARQWTASSGEAAGASIGPDGGAVKVARYDGAGERILTGHADGAARLWNARDGVLLLTLPGHEEAVTDVRFSPDESRIATGSGGGKVRLWRTADGSLERLLDGHRDELRSLAFSDDGRQLLSAAIDSFALLWDVETGASRRLGGHGDTVFGAVLSKGARHALTYSEDFTARLWKLGDGKPGSRDELIAPLQHDAWVVSGEFSPNGEEVLTASHDNLVKLWNVRNGELKAVLAGHDTAEKWGLRATYDPSGTTVATASWDGTARLWTRAAPAEIISLDPAGEQVLTAAFNRDGTLVASGTAGDLNSGFVEVWDSGTGARLLGPVRVPGRVWRLAFHPGRKEVAAVAGLDKTGESKAVLLDVETGGSRVLVHGNTREALRSIAYSRDGKRLLSAGYDRKARIWDYASLAQIGADLDHGEQIQVAAFDAAGERVVTAGAKGVVKLWRLADWSHVELRDGTARIFNAAFNGDGSRLLLARADNWIGTWDLRREPPAFTGLVRMEYEAWAAALSADESLLGAGDLGRRGTALIVDARSRAVIAELKGQAGGIRSIDITPDNRRVLTASNDGTVWIWPLFPRRSELTSFVGRGLPRCLSPRERMSLGIGAEPPDWCLRGWGADTGTDAGSWRPKWPYRAADWRQKLPGAEAAAK